MSEIFTLGIDVGSTASKCIILKDGKEIVGKSLIDVGAGTSGPSRAIEAVLEDAGLKKEDMAFTLATGYGRTSLMDGIADKQMSELSCHAKGAYFLFPKVHTVIDIGGQDVKVLRVEDGVMTNFQMNDKCAAGTGRFLEMMARTLEVDISELGPLSLKSTENIEISSMCSVFAESEVISLIARNKETSDIAHGIHMAIAAKAISLMRRVGLEPRFMMTGGVAKNPGVVKVLEEQLKAPLFISEEPEIVGALGAALYGLENIL